MFANPSSQIIGPPYWSQNLSYSLLTALRLGGLRGLFSPIACTSRNTRGHAETDISAIEWISRHEQTLVAQSAAVTVSAEIASNDRSPDARVPQNRYRG